VIRAVIFISGRGSNMQAVVKAWQSGVLQGRCQIAGVFSNRSTAAGLASAHALGLPTTVCEAVPGQSREDYDREVLQKIAAWKPQVIILAGFDRVLSPVLVNAYRDRILNIHPADPAVFRGLHGYRHAFENGLAKTRATVHLVDEGVDTGRILDYAEIDLVGAGDLAEVEARGLAIEHELYPRALARFFTAIEELKES